MQTTIKLQGMREIERKLAEVKSATAKNKMRKVLKQAGEPIAAKARSLAPVASSPYWRGKGKTRRLVTPGWLAESIGVSPIVGSRHRAKAKAFADLVIHIGPSSAGYPQAVVQEFGTVHHSANPYMRPAWAGMEMKTLDLIGGLAWAEVQKKARR